MRVKSDNLPVMAAMAGIKRPNDKSQRIFDPSRLAQQYESGEFDRGQVDDEEEEQTGDCDRLNRNGEGRNI